MHGTFDRFVGLIRRSSDFDRSPDSEEDEAWIICVVGAVPRVVHEGRGVLSDVWLGPSGRVLAAGVLGGLGAGLFEFTPSGAGYRAARILDSELRGVWGLHDGLVFAWGGTWHEPALWRGDGASWTPLPCPRPLSAIAGVRDDLIIASGVGLVARWDGSAFVAMECPAVGIVGELLVEDDDHLWAVTHAGGVLTGTVSGWSAQAAMPEAVMTPNGIARWRERIAISAGREGLFALEGDRVVPLIPKLRPLQIAADGDRLLVLEPDWLASWEAPETPQTRRSFTLWDCEALFVGR